MTTVVKVGGSLATHERLSELLRLITAMPRAVVVAGGGRAADWIRDYAAIARISEAEAHDLAVLTTELYARMLAANEPRLKPLADINQINDELNGRINRPNRTKTATPLWLATVALNRSPPPLPKKWGVSSDSLALWLAVELGATRLVLLKSRDFAVRKLSKLQKLGAVDEHFSRLWAEKPAIRVSMLAPSRWGMLNDPAAAEAEIENA